MTQNNQIKMEKKYVVKDFEAQTYYAGQYGVKQNWEKEAYLAEYFDSVEDAERFISRENGKFQIELVYVV
jgi:hypothetical protein